MAQTEVTILLMLLGMMMTPFFSEVSSNACDNLNSTFNSTTNFNITVSPTVLTANTNYTVIISGNENVTIILQALSGNAFVGNWLTQADDCSGSPLFSNTTVPLNATWVSPITVNSVEIRAIIQNPTGIYKISAALVVASTAATPGNSTQANTTNRGSVKHSNTWGTSLIQIFGLLIVTNKLLS